MKIDITPLLQAIITLLATIVTYKLIPLIKSKLSEHQLEIARTIAHVTVLAVEQLYKDMDGEYKLDTAMSQAEQALANNGILVDTDTLRSLIESEVFEKNVLEPYGIVEDDLEEIEGDSDE